jgi:hypothetical protein
MSKTSIRDALSSRLANGASPFGILRVVALVAVFTVLSLAAVQAADKDEEYLKIFNLIEQGDLLQKNGDPSRAVVKYREAEAALKNFRRDNPGWNPKLVTYRWNDLASKIAVAQDAAASGVARPAATGPATAASTAATAKPPAAAAGAPRINLLDAGAEPRKLLRLTPKPGDTQTMGLTLKMGIKMKMGEMEMPPMNLPAISTDTTATVKEVSPTGDITYETTVSEASVADDADAEDQVLEAMKGALNSVKGMSGTGTMSSRGINLTTNMKAPDTANPQVRQTIDQMQESMDRVAAHLPEEAVGVGAKWESRTTPVSQGMTINQTGTYELVAIEGDRITLKIGLTQTAANQKISNPSMPGMKVDVVKMSSKGAGKTILDLSKILPIEAALDIKTEMTMGVATGGQQQNMDMNMDMNLKMEGK